MTMYAAASVAYISISRAHGGCGQSHSRPVEQGAPVKLWALTCTGGCEDFLREDPMWSSTLSEVPETYDETKSREDFERRGALDRDQVMALAMAKLAGVELPDTMRRPISGLAPHVPAIGGAKMVCDAGHDNEPGMKFCGECGIPLRVSGKRTCPDGHEVPAAMKFCGECGQGVTPAAMDTPALEPAVPKRRLRDMRAEELREIARGKGLDDTGSRTDVLARLQAA